MRRVRFGFWGLAVRELGRKREEARAVAEARIPRREMGCCVWDDFMMGILALGGGDFLGC